ncbi:DUF5683 domain-containing protein [Flavobacteriaceae bacterium]|nr:DUF5683 domain-containing protein [Flavobacteriaceae bacterium]MDG1672682.1 DUF5683 domain-containing protein [Flavobacteriaceae bacterium]MDG2484525.1 DUF5683 domain-containing protein [Flavobacteriaceae bacterium]
MINRFNATLFCLFICLATLAQSNKDELNETVSQNKKNTSRALDPLRPAKAAFYSAVLPGLGQAYNKKFWKIPIVYGAIGTGLYFYLDNNKLYKQYRNAYKRRLAGFTDDEFYGPGDTPFLSDEALIRAQRTLKRNKELSMLVTVGLYVLNIIEANVDAHLLQYNLDENLALKPFMDFNNPNYTTQIGLSLNIKF